MDIQYLKIGSGYLKTEPSYLKTKTVYLLLYRRLTFPGLRWLALPMFRGDRPEEHFSCLVHKRYSRLQYAQAGLLLILLHHYY